MNTTAELIGVSDAARIVGRPSRTVRQVCIDLNLGTFVGKWRVLTQDDLERLRVELKRRNDSPVGRPPKS